MPIFFRNIGVFYELNRNLGGTGISLLSKKISHIIGYGKREQFALEYFLDKVYVYVYVSYDLSLVEGEIMSTLHSREKQGTASGSKGRPYINPEMCKGCELCVVACPQSVLSMSEKSNSQGNPYPEYDPAGV